MNKNDIGIIAGTIIIIFILVPITIGYIQGYMQFKKMFDEKFNSLPPCEEAGIIKVNNFTFNEECAKIEEGEKRIYFKSPKGDISMEIFNETHLALYNIYGEFIGYYEYKNGSVYMEYPVRTASLGQ